MLPAQPVVSLDETGWRIGGQRAWLHVLVAEQVTEQALRAAAALPGSSFNGAPAARGLREECPGRTTLRIASSDNGLGKDPARGPRPASDSHLDTSGIGGKMRPLGKRDIVEGVYELLTSRTPPHGRQAALENAMTGMNRQTSGSCGVH